MTFEERFEFNNPTTIEIATKMKQENIPSYEEYYFMYLDK